jgi:hypothetical protein
MRWTDGLADAAGLPTLPAGKKIPARWNYPRNCLVRNWEWLLKPFDAPLLC